MSIDDLAQDLAAARSAAEAYAARAPLGLRAVETGGGRWYLCAFEGPAFLCLDVALRAERSERRVRDAASGSLLHERLEQLVDPGSLRALAEAVGKALGSGADAPPVVDTLAAVAQAALDLAAWREAPERALASVPEVDRGAQYHERMRTAYGRFVHESEPLVAAQDTLASTLVVALRAVEEAAGAAGVGESLARRLGAAVEDCEEGAAQVVAAHLVPLRSP